MESKTRDRLLLALSIAFALFLGEVLLHWLAPPRQAMIAGTVRSPKAAIYGWHMVPKQDFYPYNPDTGEFGAAEVLNSEAWHDVEHSREKKGSPRILVIGDSVTWGLVRIDELYTRQLERRLRESGFPDAEVISMGMSGWGTDQELEALEREGVQYHPDIVIYQYCDNDNSDNAFPDASLESDPNAVQWLKVFKYRLVDGKLARVPLVPRLRPEPELPAITGWRATFRKSLILYYANETRQKLLGRYREWRKRAVASRPDFTPKAGTPVNEVSEAEHDQRQRLLEALVAKMASTSAAIGAKFFIYPITGADPGAIEWSLHWKRLQKDEKGYYRLVGEQRIYDHDRLYRDVLDMGHRRGFTVIEPKRKYQRWVYDPHPNAQGNLAMAEDLRDFLVHNPAHEFSGKTNR